jgi:N-methylhydantoinase A
MARMVVATDIGGTFTDLVALDDSGCLAIHKVLSTPANYADGLLAGVSELAAAGRWALEAIGTLLHGTTVATNAVLKKKGARTVLVTTAGFRDVLELRGIRVPRRRPTLDSRGARVRSQP